MRARVCAQSYITLCHPIDCSPPGSSVDGIFQAGILEWVAISFSRGSSWCKDRTRISCTAGGFFTAVTALPLWEWYCLSFSIISAGLTKPTLTHPVPPPFTAHCLGPAVTPAPAACTTAAAHRMRWRRNRKKIPSKTPHLQWDGSPTVTRWSFRPTQDFAYLHPSPSPNLHSFIKKKNRGLLCFWPGSWKITTLRYFSPDFQCRWVHRLITNKMLTGTAAKQ